MRDADREQLQEHNLQAQAWGDAEGHPDVALQKRIPLDTGHGHIQHTEHQPILLVPVFILF